MTATTLKDKMSRHQGCDSFDFVGYYGEKGPCDLVVHDQKAKSIKAASKVLTVVLLT